MKKSRYFVVVLALSFWRAGIGFNAGTAYASHDKPPIALDNLSYARLVFEHWREVVVVETILKDEPKKDNDSSADHSGNTDKNGTDELIKPYLRKLWLDKRVMGMRQLASGTGFVCGSDSDGKKVFICTNAHVVEDRIEVTVRTASAKEYRATVLAEDKERDAAVLAIESEENLSPVAWGDPDNAAIGEAVMALGNPQDLPYSPSHGIVSGKRPLNIVKDKPPLPFLQLDIALNFGSSGSPIFNMKGEVVGVGALILARSQGIAFAIPSTDFQKMVEHVKKQQTPATP
ncbi:trypsin-like peptidase domain-containing protein [Patescibacteria group bacterium]|nr:trypsin-like peptidase domain-containing protein [Patescibacteria group bacterium]